MITTTPIQRARKRTLKLRATNRAHTATRIAHDTYNVTSGRSGKVYQVTLNATQSKRPGRCTCVAGSFGQFCDHQIAAQIERARLTARTPLRPMRVLEADLDGHRVAKLRRLVDLAIKSGNDAYEFTRSLVKAARGGRK